MWLTTALVWTAIGAGPGPTGIEWTVIDLVRQKAYTVSDDARKLTEGGRLEAAPEGADLALEVVYEPAGPGTRVKVRLADRGGADRGLTIRLTLPLSGTDWRWWQDLDTAGAMGAEPQSNTVGLRALPGLPFFTDAERPEYGSYSVYPLGAVDSGGRWYALARAVTPLALARFAAVGGERPHLAAEVDLALSEYSEPSREAAFELWYLAGDTRDGPALRAALSRYYAMSPGDWEVRVPTFGGWMPFRDLAQLPNVDEFGFAYQEGAPNAAYDDALGALSFVYFHCAGEFANVAGYERGSEPQPPYETVVEAFNRVAEQHSGVRGAWDLCGIRGPDGQIAYRPEKTYGDFFCQACVDPDLPYGKGMIERLLARVNEHPYPRGTDGVYYDGIAAGLDYDPAHLKAADHLLLWDGKNQRPVNYNLWSSAEWAAEIHDRLKGTGKLTMLNDSSLSSFPFVGRNIDVPGGEMSVHLSRRQARLIRATVNQRPFCTLVKADFNQLSQAQIETYMRRCVAYGILFGFFDITPSGAHPGSSYWLHPEWFDRDRALFRRYMPLARELARAGWQPVPLATVDHDAFVERFGPRREGDLTYYTVSTDPSADDETEQPVRLSPANGRKGDLAVELLSGRIEPAGAVTSTMTEEDLSVWAIGSPDAQAAAALERARDVLQRRSGYLEAARSAGATLRPWAASGGGTARIAGPGRDSPHALRMDRREGQSDTSVTQSIVVNHERPRKLVVSAWSKAAGVTGEKDRRYSLYIDCYYTDGKALYGQTVDFDTGSHDWQYGERAIEPEKPIRNINVYLLFRGDHYGTVWFDDIHVALADEPTVNLLKRGDLETAGARPLAGESRAAEQINTAFGRLGVALAGGAVDWAACEELLASIEQQALAADWGDDTQRCLRDVADLRWHLTLARSCSRGAVGPPQRESRLTELATLGRPRRSSGRRSYRATAGAVPTGTVVSVDSNFDGYTPEVLTDGRINSDGAHWTQVAWASSEARRGHWIDLKLPAPAKVREIKIWWAKDTGKLWVSQTVVAQELRDEKWVDIAGQTCAPGDQPGLTVVKLPATERSRLRVYQPPGGGSPGRPDLMWVSEVQVVTG